MIGVLAKLVDHDVVAEFFELFKTPWEFHRPGRDYDVVLCIGCEIPERVRAPLIVVYGIPDDPAGTEPLTEEHDAHTSGRLLRWKADELPIYGNWLSFDGPGQPLLRETGTGRCAGFVSEYQSAKFVRIGYNVCAEVRFLLSAGQPKSQARIPTLDLHIALLRAQILEAGLRLQEIPPIPEGYKFIACLTHDVDHPTIRRHRFDHTAFGFVYRALVGSVIDVATGRASFSQLRANWAAIAKLPFVYAGLAKDFWRQLEQFPLMERGFPSTFFFIPKPGDPGKCKGGRPRRKRAAGYGINDVADQVHALQKHGCEIALHGIDAWCDSGKAREEFEEIQKVTGEQPLGVRMHWLYWDESTPAILEAAGATYDSTFGYNGEVGYRAGTAQVYRPLNAKRLLELPLIIMDTALFFPSHLHLTRAEAKARVAVVLENAERHGGCITINWHDRSIAPERLWGDFYQELIEELRGRGAWIATAVDAVNWFQVRRSFVFERSQDGAGHLHGEQVFSAKRALPGLQATRFNGAGEFSAVFCDEFPTEIPLGIGFQDR